MVTDPAAWGVWLDMLLEELKKQAAENGQPAERFDMTLALIRTIATERLENHKR